MKGYKMNGWQRLWLLVAVIYFFVVAVFAAMSFPKPESIHHTQELYDRLAPEVRKKIIGGTKSENFQVEKRGYLEEALKRGLIIEVEMPNKHIMVFSSELPKQEAEAAATQYWAVVEKSVSKQRLQHIGLAFLLWLLPALALYGFGWSIGWVYRGFKK